ncbi:MAG: hypothetical protein R3C69_06110 [Geminicoccaceae bacterium]
MTDPAAGTRPFWRPCHLIGLELGISVADMALRGEPTGAPWRWAGDVAATAKRDLEVGETLDGAASPSMAPWSRPPSRPPRACCRSASPTMRASGGRWPVTGA